LLSKYEAGEIKKRVADDRRGGGHLNFKYGGEKKLFRE